VVGNEAHLMSETFTEGNGEIKMSI
jgi:hypothetical protein